MMQPTSSPLPILEIDGMSLPIEDLVSVARERRRVAVSPQARHRMACCRAMVDVLLESGDKVYGLTTGFGKLRDVVIEPQDTVRLQSNLLRSHAFGTGDPFAEDVVRAAILLRANTLCRGNSGVRPEVVDRLVALLNDDVYPFVPQQGSVGASGDLAPLSYLGLMLIGDPAARYFPRGRRSGDGPVVRPSYADFSFLPGPEGFDAVAKTEGWTRFRPITLLAKEGLALNNGTQFMTAVAALACHDAARILRSAGIAAAMSLEAIRGVAGAFDPRIHAVRPHDYQAEVAASVLACCAGSQILDLYLNTAHLHRARIHLSEAGEFLDRAAGELAADGVSIPATMREVRTAVDALRDRIDGIVPRGSDGTVDETTLRRWIVLPPRDQIRLFDRLLRRARQDAIELLRTAQQVNFPSTASTSKVLASLVGAVDQLRRAVPDSPIVQDDYSFRCFPQVAACAWRALDHVARIVQIEMNSTTDNPLLFPPVPDGGLDAMPPDAYGAWLRASPERMLDCRRSVIGGGNFHGEPVAVAIDYLAIAMAEIGSISERRIAHLVDDAHSRGLPPFLVDSSGLNSGFMVPQYTAASLVSENKVLCHPASVDSIPTCANTEDHVSMGTIAARKAAEVIGNVKKVIAIEILAAAQGLTFRLPLQPGLPLRAVLEQLRAAGVERLTDDRVMEGDLAAVLRWMEGGNDDVCGSSVPLGILANNVAFSDVACGGRISPSTHGEL